jgi:hypothetical protein
MEYIVRWEIELDANSPEEAAINAYNSISDQDTLATVFTVKNKRTKKVIAVDAFEAAGGKR